MEDDITCDIELVNPMKPKEIFRKFEDKLREQLPTDNPDFMAELEREGVINEEIKTKINKKRIRCVAAVILNEIELSIDDPDDKKFYKLLNTMETFKNGLEILAQKIRNHLDPVGTPFVRETMEDYLMMNKTSLSCLPYDKVKSDLTEYDVITSKEKRQIECEDDNNSRMREFLDIIHFSLRDQQTIKFKKFLELLEDSDDPFLIRIAERLGGSQRVPDTDITKATTFNVVLMPVGDTTIKCNGRNGGSYLWKGHDFAITLPPDCADGTVTITLKAYLPCTTQGHCLASAVFEITASVKKFKKPVTLSFPHWLNIKSDADTKNIRFLIIQKFSCEVEKGSFEVGESFGSIELSEVGLICIYKQNSSAYFYFKKAQVYTDQTLMSAMTADFSAHVLVNLEEVSTNETTIENKYLDLLVLPAECHDEKWGIYCIGLDNPTYLQAIMKYFIDENQTNSGIQILKRQVVFKSSDDNTKADLRIVDKQDANIIKIIHNKKIIKQRIHSLDLSTTFLMLHEINFPMWCSINIIGKLSPSSSKLEVHGLCGVNQESSEFSLASPTEHGYKFETYEYVYPVIIKKPSQPEHITVQKDKTTKTIITLSWKEPNPLDELTGYEVQYTKSGEEFKKGKSILTDKDSTSCEVTGLVAHTEYQFKVAAINEGGRGLFTDVVTQFTKPSQPRELSVLKFTSTTITLSWKEANPSDIPVVGYEVQYRKSHCGEDFKKVEKSLTHDNLTCEVTGLVAYTEYQFRVAAINAAGRGPFTDVTQLTSFDYIGTAEQLKMQLDKLSNLSYDNMKKLLYANSVITTKDREIIDSKTGSERMEYLIVEIIIPSLKVESSKKYKFFLKAMEDSEDTVLRDTAKMLGGSARVPTDTTQTTRKRQQREESSDPESDNGIKLVKYMVN